MIRTVEITDRSLVRVKLWAIDGIFLACWLYIALGHGQQRGMLWAMGIGIVASCLVFAVRCERCGRPEIHFLFWKREGSPFFPRKVCPKCGLERI